MGRRGPPKHLKRIAAPKHWMLDKLGGNWAPRPSPGPHKLRECIPLILILRNRLKYALTRREVIMIVMNRKIKIDGKIRTDITYPCGFMDVISIADTNEHFRLLYDSKGRFVLHRINQKEAGYKLCRVKKLELGKKGSFSRGKSAAIPYIVTHDGRTIRYPDPLIKVNDTVMIDISTGKIIKFYKFSQGQTAVVTSGHNIGRIGVIVAKERHIGGFDIVHLKDENNNEFATRISNVFVIEKKK